MYGYYVDIYLLLMDAAWKKELQSCVKIGIVMPLLIFKIQYTN
jgi:hypothetical protein